MAARAAAGCGLPDGSLAVCSTGTIGNRLDIARVLPAIDTIAPEASDETPIIANTIKSLAPWVRAFSAGA